MGNGGDFIVFQIKISEPVEEIRILNLLLVLIRAVLFLLAQYAP